MTAGGGASAEGGRASEALALVRALRRQAGGRFWGVLAVQALAVLTEGLGLVLLLPILQLAQEEAGAALGGLALPIPAALRDLETLLVLFVAVIAAQAVLNRWRSLFVAGVTYDFVAALRADLLAALTAARWEALVRLRRAEAEQMILVESDRTTVSVSLLFSLVQSLAAIAVTVAIAALLSPAMLLVAGGLGLLALAVVWPVRGRSAAAGDRLFANREAQQRLVSAVMTGLKAMRAGGLEASRRATFATALAEGRDALLAFVRLSSLTAGLLQVAFAGAAAAFVWAALRVAGLDLASVVVFLAVLLRLAPRVSGLQSQVQELAADLSAYRAVRAFAARLAAARDPSVDAPRRPPPPLREAIRVEGLSVRLGGEEGPLALDDVSLDIPAGRLTALIGPSGSGKTTLADVVSGILSPGVGRVLVDGTPLADADRAAWRGGVAYVAQDPVLMRDTVRENLLEAEPAADDGALAEALRTAVADELVAGLPGGLDAPVGERGALLSGGERQRIAIAQALLRRPQLLVLDEATSGLDWDTQGRLADNLARVAAERGLTTLVVAHRPEAIRHADLVHVLGDGRLVESGPPARLAASGGTFAAGLLRPAGPGGAGPGDARLEGRTEAGARPQLTP